MEKGAARGPAPKSKKASKAEVQVSCFIPNGLGLPLPARTNSPRPQQASGQRNGQAEHPRGSTPSIGKVALPNQAPARKKSQLGREKASSVPAEAKRTQPDKARGSAEPTNGKRASSQQKDKAVLGPSVRPNQNRKEGGGAKVKNHATLLAADVVASQKAEAKNQQQQQQQQAKKRKEAPKAGAPAKKPKQAKPSQSLPPALVTSAHLHLIKDFPDNQLSHLSQGSHDVFAVSPLSLILVQTKEKLH